MLLNAEQIAPFIAFYSMNVNFIIVGQGLAGTLLSHELIRQGKSVLVFDDPGQPKASSVAAGLINPVVFRRMTKSRALDEAFPAMETTYHQLEELLQEQFYFPGPIHRILGEEEVALWHEKVFAGHSGAFPKLEIDSGFRHRHVSAPFGIGTVTNAGRLDLPKLIGSFSRFLERKQHLRPEKFDFEQLHIFPGKVQYKEVSAETIIFCEGPSADMNPFFQNLKFKSSKGELLELRIPELKLDRIISRDIFVLPFGNDRYKVGSTYSWDDLNWQTTSHAAEELLGKLKSLIALSPEIINHKAGIRPTMHDRNPVIGLLPDIRQVGIFNGLGSKGVLSGPWLARQIRFYSS